MSWREDMTICKACKGYIPDIGGHNCPNGAFDQYRQVPPTHYPPITAQFRWTAKCDMCGSTAIDHTEHQCNMNQQLKNINKKKSK